MKTKFKILITMLMVMLFCNACSNTVQQEEPSKDLEETCKDLEILDSGFTFSEDTGWITYAFEVKNPNENYAMVEAVYRVTFYDENNEVVESSEDCISRIYPTTIEGFSNNASASSKPEKMEIELIEEPEIVETELQESDLSAIDINVNESSISGIEITGKVKNNGDNSYECIEIFVVLKDENGKIVGGPGWTEQLSAVEAHSEIPFSVIRAPEATTDKCVLYVRPL